MLKLQKVSKSFKDRLILDQIDLELTYGKSYAITGRSGEGKSTLLHILGALESPDQGTIEIENELICTKNGDFIRKNKIGFIFQNFNVLEDFSVLDNLKIACQIRSHKLDEKSLLQCLANVELIDKASHLARTLSGGERQRLAIARALMHKPKIILADEPTGSLDMATASKIEQLLLKTVTLDQALLIIVTHDLDLAQKCDRIYHLKDGKLK